MGTYKVEYDKVVKKKDAKANGYISIYSCQILSSVQCDLKFVSEHLSFIATMPL